MFESLIENENQFISKMKNIKQKIGLDIGLINELKEIEQFYIDSNQVNIKSLQLLESGNINQ